jgi:hypothetical protein
VIAVLQRQGSLVIEYRLGIRKADAAMLEFVGRVLCLVVLNFEWLNYAYFICIKKRASVPAVAMKTKD